ncbi:uncharacterized protein PV07_08835 [Cladophialophora immunda]|uniref:DUF1446 domain-containing protein n=1 Tax=Cladophialophora immunda TaxID=569365 RepID=A0A0D2CPZ9_9EURO|nr:uncharacterized protein PV07_08835 [Cladophialophora immunda]KIW25674.1 hypothetical protein PV07_08835 [Cladophialophora immunda]
MAGAGQKRPVRIANCAGAKGSSRLPGDPGYQMYRQATAGEVDAITGDFLAEFNIAMNAQAMQRGEHPGYEPSAWDGIEMCLEVLAQKRIKLVINGGALNPRGMAERAQTLATSKGLSLKIAYVSGDDLLPRARELLHAEKGLVHLDDINPNVNLAKDTLNFLDDETKTLLSANAYLGARAIVRGLREGADIIICGRVADASPGGMDGMKTITKNLLGLWWRDASDPSVTRPYEYTLLLLTSPLDLIECSAYVTGSNFCGFDKYPLDDFVDLGFGIAEVDVDGSCVITKHETLKGMVTVDTVTCQLLYEIQGNLYLNSDVTADLEDIEIQQVGLDRVRVSNVKGLPPPPTTKFAVFYNAGWTSEMYFGACGLEVERKMELMKRQTILKLKEWGYYDKMDILSFELYGRPEPNARSQAAATSLIRIVGQSTDRRAIELLSKSQDEMGMQHYHGKSFSMDFRSRAPRSFIGYFPAVIAQTQIQEEVCFVDSGLVFNVGHVGHTRPIGQRRSYETASPVDLGRFGPTEEDILGRVVYARSGDKGGNINIGFFVHADDEFDWLRSFLTCDRMIDLIADDWRPQYHLERVEFKNIRAVHFVVYGILGRGVTSTPVLDTLGKSFADFIRARSVLSPSLNPIGNT